MRTLLIAIALLTWTAPPRAQDFYDVNILRTVDLQFHDTNWWTLLQQNYRSQTNILADLTVDGVVYPSVGVRIRGNTSYTALPSGSQKVSLNVAVDFVDPNQRVMGQDTLNFNNCFLDPTFCREVVFHNILARWIPSGRANHVVVTLNGANWGVYANIQQYGKEVLRQWFEDEDGMRVKCANNPNGPGLQYFGTDPRNYRQYEIKSTGGLANPVNELIAVCNAVSNTPPANWPLVDQVFAVDPSIWAVVLENLYSDDDSYINKGCDFVMYRNPVDGRMHLHQTDGNETWTEDNWQPDHNFARSNKPFLSNVLSNTHLRGRYFAHMRAAMAEFSWANGLSAEFAARRALIESAVQADPKKIYTYSQFQQNFESTVVLSGFFSGPRVGLREYVGRRRALLLADPEVAAAAPTIQNVAASTNQPGVPIYVTAKVTGTDPIAVVRVYYQSTQTAPYSFMTMADDGMSGDGAAGDGVYGALLPVTGVGGTELRFYVGAVANNTPRGQSYEPQRTEFDPIIVPFSGGTAPSDIVISEVLAINNSVIADPSGSYEDFVELYNKGAATIDVSGMYLSDNLANTTKWQIPAGTTIGAGQTLLIWADNDPTEGPLHATFQLSGAGEEVGLWATDGTTLLDSLLFGPQIADTSTGRIAGANPLLVTFPVPTPNMPNEAGCGFRAFDRLDPLQHTLSLAAGGTGAVGTNVNLAAAGLQPGAPAFYLAGVAPTYVAYPAFDIVALTNGALLANVTAGVTGVAALAGLPIPANPALVGVDLYFQVVGTDAAGDISASNALHLSICP